MPPRAIHMYVYVLVNIRDCPLQYPVLFIYGFIYLWPAGLPALGSTQPPVQ
jgi:hypothetical protein